MNRETIIPNTKQMTLGELIEELKVCKQDSFVRFDFGTAVPTDCNSYRGIYEEIALGYRLIGKDDPSSTPQQSLPVVSELVSHLRLCIGKELLGWKGGCYEMDEDTPVWVANNGDATSTVPIGVAESNEILDGTIILTSFVDIEKI